MGGIQRGGIAPRRCRSRGRCRLRAGRRRCLGAIRQYRLRRQRCGRFLGVWGRLRGGGSSRWLCGVVSVADLRSRLVFKVTLLRPDTVLLDQTFLLFRCAAEPIWLIIITVGSAVGGHSATDPIVWT